MNLHGIVSGAIATVNPMTQATIYKSVGYMTAADGTQMPDYLALPIVVQVQGLTEHEYSTLEHEDHMNVQGVIRKLYAYGSTNGVIRDAFIGGDLIQFGGAKWKVVRVFETWPDWSSVAIKQQLGPI